jgi:tetratricopeptide (TPR) repeat protein
MTTAFVASMLVALATVSPQGQPTYESCVRAYQAGMIERAIADLQARSDDNNLAREIDRWVEAARRARRPTDLEAALLLHTELFFVTWDNTFPPARASGYAPKLRAQADILRRVHAELVAYDARTPFLRMWYLLWESFLQLRSAFELAQYGDHLAAAVRAFPDDAEVLLAAGTRFEMRWWLDNDNLQRHPAAAASDVQDLRVARDWFGKAAAVPHPIAEVPLRLGRVLLALGEVDAAAIELRRAQGAAKEPGLRYLSTLLLGAVAERRGDLDAAAAAYAEAATFVPFPQSARLAAAYVAHVRGQRTDAANAVVAALGNRSNDYDPWWLYTRGFSLQFDRLRQSARGLVTAAATASGR